MRQIEAELRYAVELMSQCDEIVFEGVEKPAAHVSSLSVRFLNLLEQRDEI